ncbi:M42 family metallopeptidase [Pelagibacterium halotolerans]|uniref:Endo-1,4-beta-glucanase n=1 Tax=Pelagibacterium halotolerans (strain DSM 22347 / JCM 15775 / CGMCC 1.7692 / B2) TaxID=1082931 RepID=G4REY8_PELHB|nr:M20/M25/M40 family metallo-hydrolase [Pelagibacterium halotolerans]AEQ52921.1 endo-1,4-beta-glucanase [Pelagibacterium halotolerans B2]QJR17409.1 M20/M25/M40 family metallo-hydrolase [Pelagibacterium halotolerans]SEA73453.1 endoglucanase [Pelagibacterium halotolerans]
MNIDLLRALCETPGVPGREHRVRKLIETEIEGLFDEVRTDSMGSLIAVRKSRTKAKNPLKIMLLCHMDEIGFLVTHVSEKGWIHIDNVGGFDPRTLFARRVKVVTPDGDYPGVMNAGGRPLHISSPEDRKKIPAIKEFFVDIGFGAETREKVRVGDFIVMDEPLIEMGEKIVSKALDNRVACWLGIEAIRALAESGVDHECEIHVAFTTQEEVGLRGARTAAFAVSPDIGLGIDTTLACDTPGVPENEMVTAQGKGVGLTIKDGSFIADFDLVEEIEALAKKQDIPVQRSILASGGQDAAAAQQAAAGARAIGIVVGTRYIHTVAEMIEKSDLKAALDILVAYLKGK